MRIKLNQPKGSAQSRCWVKNSMYPKINFVAYFKSRHKRGFLTELFTIKNKWETDIALSRGFYM